MAANAPPSTLLPPPPVTRFWRRLVEADREVTDPAERRRARLLATLTLLLVPLTLAATLLGPRLGEPVDGSPAPPPLAGWAAVAGLAIVYALARTEYHRWGAALLVVLGLLVPVLAAIDNPLVEDRAVALTFLSIPVLLASLFLTVRQTAVTTFLSLLFIAAYPRMDARVTPGSVVVPFLVVLFLSVLLLVSTALRERMQREAERQREALLRAESLAALGSLASGLAHEINNPLQYLKGNLELSAAETAHPEAARRVRDSLTAVARLEGISRLLAALVRADREGGGLLDLGNAARDVASALTPGLPDPVRIDVEPPAEPLPVRARAAGIHRAVLAVLRNAVDSVAASGGTVRVTSRAIDGFAEVSVADDGPGMDDEELRQAFLPFYTTPEGNVGLGLSIAQAMLADEGGELSVDSARGRGTTVRMRLPLTKE